MSEMITTGSCRLKRIEYLGDWKKKFGNRCWSSSIEGGKIRGVRVCQTNVLTIYWNSWSRPVSKEAPMNRRTHSPSRQTTSWRSARPSSSRASTPPPICWRGRPCCWPCIPNGRNRHVRRSWGCVEHVTPPLKTILQSSKRYEWKAKVLSCLWFPQLFFHSLVPPTLLNLIIYIYKLFF